MKKNLSTIALVLIFFIGLSLLLYPTFSNWWNSMHQSRAIAGYSESVAAIDDTTYKRMLLQANNYNKDLTKRPFMLQMSEEEKEVYESLLDITGTGIMGYVEIPLINCSLPIYHGTNEAVLQIAVGHIEGSSLPVGGKSTHTVLSGHRGLPSARLFTDIDKLAEGDQFLIRTLDEVLTYEVDKINIVLPNELDTLRITKGKDYCTLVTCTPYGVNTHRLLVRGHRVETVNTTKIRVTADAMQIEPIMVAPVVAAPVLLLMMIIMLVFPSRKNFANNSDADRKK